MAYVAWSVVFGEQPTAAKWNILGTNDASFNDGTGIADDAILARHIANLAVSNPQMAADTFLWEKLASVTLGSAGDTLSSGTFTARKYLRVYFHIINSGALSLSMRLNNDSGNNYTHKYDLDASTGSVTSTSSIGTFNGTFNVFGYLDIINVAASPKLGKIIWVSGISSAATAPTYLEQWMNWVNTSNQITRVDFLNSGAGDMAIGSQLLVLGHD